MNRLKQITHCFLIFSVAFTLMQCKDGKKEKVNTEEMKEIVETSTIEKSEFGANAKGENVDLYTLTNRNGMEVKIMTYGGIITHLTAPDKDGVYKDVVLGFDTLEEYLDGNPFFGALLGRYGNRIAKGKFSLDGVEYTLETNNGPNHLHGGSNGFDKAIWKVLNAEVVDGNSILKLSYFSKDMDAGFPGNVETIVTYTLDNDNMLAVNYEATTDKKTILNLSQHSYFNLSGDFDQAILDHEVVLNADQFVAVDETLIPTGDLSDVSGTPFDFRTAKVIGEEIDADHDQIVKGGGYDHCWVLNNQNEGVRLVASAHHPGSGRLLQVFTDQPGVQFYTGNFLNGTIPSKTGGTYGKRSGFCLETQHYPDSPNQPTFPSVTLNPGEKYATMTSFKFTTK
ncbi:aldose 1-epimerase [Saonia flava]|uniref:Aldose 1-epimerase n=1 Tax=Saonia flava TaxID=523696 RepID=A0A846R5S5_9FLAO|nr:aldose epimerase family protein [Saonia flava]NJB72129.1 aldose 1-epimerase [Saonia flava]